MSRTVTYTSPEGAKFRFRKPSDIEYAEFQSQASDVETRSKAMRLLIKTCHEGEPAALEALLSEYPALVTHDKGIGTQLIKLAGAGLGSFSSD